MHANALLLTGLSDAHASYQLAPGVQVQTRVGEAFLRLQAAAAQAGFDLVAVSGFRSFARQRAIWNRKFTGELPLLSRHETPLAAMDLPEVARVTAILAWSALPGTSRHHWGTDIDIVDAHAHGPNETATLTLASTQFGGAYFALHQWLDEVLPAFGFYRPYDRDRGGVATEPWHISFAPLAAGYAAALNPAVWAATCATEDLAGKTAVLAQLPTLFAQYVHNVAPLPADLRQTVPPDFVVPDFESQP